MQCGKSKHKLPSSLVPRVWIKLRWHRSPSLIALVLHQIFHALSQQTGTPVSFDKWRFKRTILTFVHKYVGFFSGRVYHSSKPLFLCSNLTRLYMRERSLVSYSSCDDSTEHVCAYKVPLLMRIVYFITNWKWLCACMELYSKVKIVGLTSRHKSHAQLTYDRCVHGGCFWDAWKKFANNEINYSMSNDVMVGPRCFITFTW